MLLDTLNEDTQYNHFTSQTLDDAIQLAKATIFPIIGEGSQEERTAISTGKTRIPIQEDGIVGIVRVDSVDGCGLRQADVEEANQITLKWRGCDYEDGQEPEAYVLDPDSPRALWVVPATAAGVEIKYTVTTADSNDVPDHLLVPIRHFALAYCYEKLYGNNHNSEIHAKKAYNFLDTYIRRVRMADGR